ncbi:DUF2062 domain-containing protein [Agaribacterium sp. ZY112]|uniref:DUF2062 domain-containing protein n=1 Tax=Agaribacterium sp. ZY112 TaxID=3233574 RepID=UPI0035258D55
MPRKLLKRWTPDPKDIHGNPALKFLGTMLHDPNLFHLNRHSVSVACFVGLFIAFMPIPGQIPLAALAALRLRCNLPLAVILVWISNPLTMPIIFYLEYKLGSGILMQTGAEFSFDFSWQWFKTVFPSIWQPLLLGSFICSVFFGCVGYLSIQWFWRWHVVDRWKQRQARKKNQA